MINLTKAILHILDADSGSLVLSKQELDLTDDTAYSYVSRCIERSEGDTKLHEGKFIGAENEFRRRLYQLGRDMLDFVSFSRWAAEQAWDVLSQSDKLEASDLLVAEYFENERRCVAVLRLTDRPSYTHLVGLDEEGEQHCSIVCQNDILPDSGKKADEAAFFDVAAETVRFSEKSRTVNGESCPLFSKGILKCSVGVSADETVTIIKEIAETVAETYGEDKTAAVSRAKAEIGLHLDENDDLPPFDLGEDIFAGNEAMQKEFRRQAEAAGLPEKISVPKKLAVKTAKNQKIRTDTGIEITFPLDYAENTDYLEFSRGEDGRIIITVKNVGSIENKG